MTDSNGKGPLYFVFLNENNELIHAGTTDGINNDDFNLNMVTTPNEGGNEDNRIDYVVNKIMNNGTMKKYFSKNSSSSDESKDENKNDADNDGYNFIFNSENTLTLNDNDDNDYNKILGGGIPDILLPNEDGTGTKHTIVNVGGDGNCFFYALFYGILAKCENGKTASQLIQEMFDIHINVDDEHVVFAKNSNEKKSSDNEVRNEKYKNTELYFATRMRLLLGNSEEFKEMVKKEINYLNTLYNDKDSAKINNETIIDDYSDEFLNLYKNRTDNFDNYYEEYIKMLTSPIQNNTTDINNNDAKKMFDNIKRDINIFNEQDYSYQNMITTIKAIVKEEPTTDNEMKYPDASPDQVKFLQKYMKERNIYVYISPDNKQLHFNKYNNVIILFKTGGHYQYIIPETPKSNNGGGKRKTQRKRPKSSHKNKSIKTK